MKIHDDATLKITQVQVKIYRYKKTGGNGVTGFTVLIKVPKPSLMCETAGDYKKCIIWCVRYLSKCYEVSLEYTLKCRRYNR